MLALLYPYFIIVFTDIGTAGESYVLQGDSAGA
jgi:hypothetical protein